MQRTVNTVINEYIDSCKMKDENRITYRDELYNDDLRAYNLKLGLQYLAEIYLFNPKKIDKEMLRFKQLPAQTKEFLYAIAEELALDPKKSRKEILSAVTDNINWRVTDLTVFFNPSYYRDFYLAEALAWGYRFASSCNRGVFPNQLFLGVTYDAKELAKYWRQFCAVILVFNEEYQNEKKTINLDWDVRLSKLSKKDWQLFCYIIANSTLKLTLKFNFPDESAFLFKNKMKALANAVVFSSNKVPTLRDLASYSLFFRSNTKLITDEKEKRYFADVYANDECIRQECSQGEMEFLEKSRAEGFGRLRVWK